MPGAHFYALNSPKTFVSWTHSQFWPDSLAGSWGTGRGEEGRAIPPNENPGYSPIAACHSLLELTEISGTDVSQRSTTKWSQCFSKFSQLSAFKLIQLGIQSSLFDFLQGMITALIINLIQSSSFNLVSPKSSFNLVRLRQPAALVSGFSVRLE